MSESSETPLTGEVVGDAADDTATEGMDGDVSSIDDVPADTATDGEPTDMPSIRDAERTLGLETLVSERTADLQRLQAEYVNYKRRVDRDRHQARQLGVESVITEMLPVLDTISLARSHGDLTGGFKAVADALEKVTDKHGLKPFGEVGDEFDPRLHDALMHMQMAGITVTTCSQVMQQGYLLNDRVLRPARVAVSDPDPDADRAPAPSESATDQSE